MREELNAEQKKAVETTEGPVLIVAGAGAGKTKTITHRIKHLIEKGVPPHQILAITFTNKAAREMKERVEHLLRGGKRLTSYPFVSTFHSLGVHILKEQCQLLGLPRQFGIYDRDDSKRAVKAAIVAAGYDPKLYEPGRILSIISKEKGNFQTAGTYSAKTDESYLARVVTDTWERYEETLKKEKSLDFDDLLLKTAILLSENADVRAHYQNVWTYVHIDEYQDTNKVQYLIAKLLAEKHRNICVVGDTDQNIYGWRGAELKNILNFEKEYPEAKIIFLEENYRSTQTILAAANTVISKNKYRIDKKLFTRKGDGEKIGLVSALDESHEAEVIAKKCKTFIKDGVTPSEIAVLYRANFQSRALEEAFLKNDVSYQLLGTRFFERKEVKDVLSYIKAALNPESWNDFVRITNVPPRGIGKVTLLKIHENKEGELPDGMRRKIHDLRILLGRLKDEAGKMKPSELVRHVIKHSGMETSLKTGTDEDKERLENAMELATLATKYDHMEPLEGLEKLLADAALATDQDSLLENKDGVKLMTVHAAKGLEFDYVFVTGLEENLFPHRRLGEVAIEGEEGEEERRLFYVAVTRARKKLFLTYAQIRTIFGSRQVNIPSEFISDIGEELVEAEEVDSWNPDRKPLFRIDF